MGFEHLFQWAKALRFVNIALLGVMTVTLLWAYRGTRNPGFLWLIAAVVVWPICSLFLGAWEIHSFLAAALTFWRASLSCSG